MALLTPARSRHGSSRSQPVAVPGEQLRDEVAGWLLLGAGTHTEAGPSVLEAKVHIFLRSPPHLVRCTGEAGHLLPDGATICPHEGCEAKASFPLGVCLGCGQDYDLESGPDGEVRHAACTPTLLRPRPPAAAAGTQAGAACGAALTPPGRHAWAAVK